MGGEFPPLLRAADSSRSSCKGCKLRIEKGDLRLMIPTSPLKRDDACLHARCAATSKWAEPLRQASARDRQRHPELEAALAAIEPKKRRR